jgi:pimeloyl-ACP methyl ester carboxylesterase
MATSQMTYHTITVDGLEIFYRQVGSISAPTIVLLHGFPSSSRMYDSLIPHLAEKYHVIAPDYPGFGHSDWPSPSIYTYTFDNLADTIKAFLQKLKISRYTLFLQDYGGPIGFRIMLKEDPKNMTSLIIQNANAYKEGLGVKWTNIAKYWDNPLENEEVFKAFTSFEGTKQRHVVNTKHPELYNPDTWTDEHSFLCKKGQDEIQTLLLKDYENNIKAYPDWQKWLKDNQPKTLVLWGENDPSFISPGAKAYQRDLPNAEIHLLDAGHFALDEKTNEIAALTLVFLSRTVSELSSHERFKLQSLQYFKIDVRLSIFKR